MPEGQRFGIQIVDVQPMIGPEQHIEQFRHGGFIAGFIKAQAQAGHGRESAG